MSHQQSSENVTLSLRIALNLQEIIIEYSKHLFLDARTAASFQALCGLNADPIFSFEREDGFLKVTQHIDAEEVASVLSPRSEEVEAWVLKFACNQGELGDDTEDDIHIIIPRLATITLKLLWDVAASYNIPSEFQDQPWVYRSKLKLERGLSYALEADGAIPHLQALVEKHNTVCSMLWDKVARRNLDSLLGVPQSPRELTVNSISANPDGNERINVAPTVPEAAETNISEAPSDPRGMNNVTPAIGRVSSNIFRDEGAYWSITFAGITKKIGDSKGMRYIAELLGKPAQPVDVLALEALFNYVPDYDADDEDDDNEPGGEKRSGSVKKLGDDKGTTRPRRERISDKKPQPIELYRQHMQELKRDEAEAKQSGDMQKAKAIKEKMHQLKISVLARASGLFLHRA